MSRRIDGLPVADGRDGDDGHVDAVEEGRPRAAQDLEAGHPDGEDQKKDGKGNENPFFAVHRALWPARDGSNLRPADPESSHQVKRAELVLFQTDRSFQAIVGQYFGQDKRPP
jgi:hypothetical protein